MTYTKLPDEFTEDPRVVALSDAAFRLHVSAFVYANRLLTDGFVPEAQVSMLKPRFSRKTLKELIVAGLWTREEGGYRLTEFLEHQLSREQVLVLRRERSDAGRRGGLRSGEVRRDGRTNPQATAQAMGEARA